MPYSLPVNATDHRTTGLTGHQGASSPLDFVVGRPRRCVRRWGFGLRRHVRRPHDYAATAAGTTGLRVLRLGPEEAARVWPRGYWIEWNRVDLVFKREPFGRGGHRHPRLDAKPIVR